MPAAALRRHIAGLTQALDDPSLRPGTAQLLETSRALAERELSRLKALSEIGSYGPRSINATEEMGTQHE